MSLPNNELVLALTDVRRAYRLLWAFQKRILDYNRIIRERLGFTHWSAYSKFDAPGANPEGKWVWSLLPMADMIFKSVRHQDNAQYPGGKWDQYPKANDAGLYVRLRADTGIPATARTDPSPLIFDPVEGCHTKLSLFLVINRNDHENPMFFWNVMDECSKITPGPGMTVSPPNIAGIDIFGMDLDVAELPDEEALLRGLDAFAAAAGAALGVPFDQFPKS